MLEKLWRKEKQGWDREIVECIMCSLTTPGFSGGGVFPSPRLTLRIPLQNDEGSHLNLVECVALQFIQRLIVNE